MSRGWFAERTDTCKCGHDKAEHAERSGSCTHLKPAGQEWTDNHGNKGRDCWCKAFDGEPWPWTISVRLHAIGEPDGEGMATYGRTAESTYTVQKQNHAKTYGPYKTEAGARRKCDELNREMAQGPLDPEFIERRKRLVRLAPDGVYYLYDDRDGPPGARWPVKPDRYLGFGFADGWHGDSWVELYPTLDAVREALEDEEGNELERVIDLDTGDEVAFERRVSVEIGVASCGAGYAGNVSSANRAQPQ